MAIAGILAREKLYIALKKVTESSSAISGIWRIATTSSRRCIGQQAIGFDQDELGVWHDEDGDPVLLLSAKDLLPSEAKALVVIEQPAGIWHINF
jgi:hypothetical protein